MAPCSDLHHKNLIKQYLALILDFKNIWYCLFIFWATPKPCFLENSWGISLSGACMRNSLWSFGPHGRELWGQRESYVHLVNTAMVMIRTCSGGLCTDIHRRASFSVLFWRDSADTIFTTGISVCPEHNFEVSNETFTWIPDITAHIHFLSSCPPGLSSEMPQPRKRSPPHSCSDLIPGLFLGPLWDVPKPKAHVLANPPWYRHQVQNHSVFDSQVHCPFLLLLKDHTILPWSFCHWESISHWDLEFTSLLQIFEMGWNNK